MTRLFILDDEMMIRQGIRYAINWEEHDIVVCGEASNGRAALRSLPSCNPDVIIADIQMPQMDGYKATQAIRNLPDRDKACIPIIAMTANAFEEDKRDAITAGMNGHIAKPIQVDKLLSMLAVTCKS